MSDRSFDDNISSWVVDAPADRPAAALDRDLEVDVAIVGGGFTGVTTAYHLAGRHPELGIALFEATRLGNGASGRNGGLVLNGITVKDIDPDVMAREHRVTREAIDGIEAMIREHELPVRFRRDGCVHVSTTTESAEEAHRIVELLGERGVPVRYLTRDELPGVLRIENAYGAVLDPTEAQLAGVDLVRALRPVLVERGVKIYEGTPVERIREGATIELVAGGHTVRAKAIVLATSGYTPRLGYFRGGLLPVISHVIATEPLPEATVDRLGLGKLAGWFDDLPRLAYGCVDHQRRMIFGGGTTASYGYRFNNATTYDAKLGDHATRALHGSMLRYFPELADVPLAHRWSGPLDLTLPRHCGIGVIGDHDNVYYGLGYSGHGITLANLAGRVIADLYDGNRDAWKDCAFYNLRPSGIPPEPFRWLGYHVYTKVTGKSPYKKLG